MSPLPKLFVSLSVKINAKIEKRKVIKVVANQEGDTFDETCQRGEVSEVERYRI
jgi:hypothetical protein